MTDVQKLRALLDAATARPWRADVWYGTDDGGWAAVGPHCVASDADGFDDAPETPSYDQAMADAALIAAAVNALPELLDEVERLRVRVATVSRRAEEAEAERTRQMLFATAADLKAQKASAQAAAGRVAIRMLMDDHDPNTYSRCRDRECDHVRLGLSALGDDAGRALLDALKGGE